MEERNPTTFKDFEEGPGEVKEDTREVECVGPKEDTARGTSPRWEAKEPFNRGGLEVGGTPKPTRVVVDFSSSGKESTCEDGDGKE